MNERAPKNKRPRDRKSQLAAVASELFRARGYHGVGINDIAAAAGVTGPALYRHFADKQAILGHVLLSGIEEMEAATERAFELAETPTPEQIRALLTSLATKSVERREVAALWRWEGRHLGADDQQAVRERSTAMLATWAKLLMRVRPELAADDAELLCWAVLSVFGSVSVHHTSVAKRRFGQLLVDIALRVLHTGLPEPDGPPAPEPPTPLTQPSRREQLLTAAAELFRKRGFTAVSMEDIGKAAGIAGPSVYRHFPSKAGLLSAIGRRAADRLALAADHALLTRAPSDERQALRGLAESYVQTLTGPPELLVSFSVDRVHIEDRDRTDLVRIQRDYVARWVSLLEAAHPELNQREAKITVHAALTIANDLTRTRRVSGRPGLAAELVALMSAALDIA
ncbi:TetR family transcriptional regulator [Prauserella sp. PE36]|uniref:TetR/AcrR family transcriptional regulator n=1 Tax=Prauserella endophytica TaxID=1592324 RepID=A0ABY2RWW1_9PSEU|nr:MULTISPECIES: TetR/AcrR family transcriptional regulator [Prauserella]PXY26698.1 TetR family transcriptional regulator [Prauserella coralliicola]RBM16519.1 TetR family transcriptional regulator [Prauserella sp. PE36]TKG63798.1 TetR/AcrR family transcriptional regulator [Prauserella endophytica]